MRAAEKMRSVEAIPVEPVRPALGMDAAIASVNVCTYRRPTGARRIRGWSVEIRFVVVAGASLLVGNVVVGCSSPPPASAPSGTIPAGTAVMTINDQKLATSEAVDCTFIQSMTTIKTGDDAAGATVVIDNAAKLDAKSVDLGENATVSLLGRTFTIAGTADGFNVQDPSKRTPGKFSIKVSC
jgi:lipoprotein LpqH